MKVVGILVGDVVNVKLPTDQCDAYQHEGNNAGLRGVLNESFGKIVEAPAAHDNSMELEDICSEPTDHGLKTRTLQLSLEEAFYLKHVKRCVELIVPGHELSDARSSCERRVEEHGSGCQGVDPDSMGVVDRERCSTEGQGQYPALGASSGDAASPLGDDEAWRYCCGRRPGFPSTFAIYRHFRTRGYVVHSGQKYGAHFVLYEGSPDEVHSRYCVHVMDVGGGDSWGHMKTMTRLMPDVAKSLLVCGVSYDMPGESPASSPASFPLNTSSLAALRAAKVAILSFSRSSDSEREAPGDTKGSSGGRVRSSSEVGGREPHGKQSRGDGKIRRAERSKKQRGTSGGRGTEER